MAQVSGLGPIASPDGKAANARNRRPTAPAPAGVPGARAEPELSVPAERGMIDMPPTEALFDAINRGDLLAAKDSIGRGADIHGKNVLGLTPLELAVDLGRNDISFLLLSLRGGAGYSTTNVPRNVPVAAPSAVERRAERRAEQQAQREQQAATRAAARAEPAETPRAARRFAGDGGAPVPQAGFLGFDSAR